MRSWILNNGVLCEVQIPTYAHVSSSISISYYLLGTSSPEYCTSTLTKCENPLQLNAYISQKCPYTSCFGFAVSPGNIAMAMVGKRFPCVCHCSAISYCFVVQ